jgi:superfamily II DNA/RNA helicase
MTTERSLSINHGHYPCGTGDEGVLLSVLFSRQEKAVIFTCAPLVERLCDELRAAGIQTFRFDSQMREAKREEAIHQFAVSDSGALVTSLRMCTGWRVDADVLIFSSCIINLDRNSFDQALARANVKAIHYFNCVFTGSNAAQAMEARGIPKEPRKADKHSLHAIAKAIAPALGKPLPAMV